MIMSSTPSISNQSARSLPGCSSGLYIPIHRRGASASALSSPSSSFSERASLSPNMSQARQAAVPRARSVSPSYRLDSQSLITPHPAMIPPASKIPNTYTISELLAIASSPTVGLSSSQRAQADAHLPFMLSKRLRACLGSSSPASTPLSAVTPPSGAPTTSSLPSSPLREAAELVERSRTSTTLPQEGRVKTLDVKTEPRRRRAGRKPLNTMRVIPGLGVSRRGAGWRWGPHAPSAALGAGAGFVERESWRRVAAA